MPTLVGIPEQGTQADTPTLRLCVTQEATGIAAVWKQLESHNEVEEQLVYSLPSKLLTSNEQLAVVEGIRCELQNLPPRFSDAREGRKG